MSRELITPELEMVANSLRPLLVALGDYERRTKANEQTRKDTLGRLRAYAMTR